MPRTQSGPGGRARAPHVNAARVVDRPGAESSSTTDRTFPRERLRGCAARPPPGRRAEPLLGDRLPSGTPAWKHDEWILAHGLDGAAGWSDPEAERIRPRWAGERFSLADAVGVLFTAGAA